MKKINQKKIYKGGQTILITVFFFSVIAAVITTGVSFSVANEVRFMKNYQNSARGYLYAESSLEDVIYRFKNDMNVDSTESLSSGAISVSTVIDQTATQTKEIVATASSDNTIRKVKASVISGVGTSVRYGVQAGGGGFTMGNATVNGSAYAARFITGSNGAKVTGTATASNSKNLALDQSNVTPSTPPYSININTNNSTQEDFAQSFTVSTTSVIHSVELYIKKNGNPSDVTVKIAASSASGVYPETTSFAQGTLSASSVASSYGWVTVNFTTLSELYPVTTYWIILDGTNGNGSNNFTLGANDTYAGHGRIGNNTTGNWNNTAPPGRQAYFKIHLGGVTGVINNIIIGAAAVGDGIAHEVTNSTIAASLFCQTGSGNNKACDTSASDSPYRDMPINYNQIDHWKNDAATGGTINGDYTPGGGSSSIGPKKIVGDLILPNNYVLTITGSLWVTGKIRFSNNNEIKLDSSYGANGGVIVTDGVIDVNNNANVHGTGIAGSYLIMVTTSRCPNATACAGAYAINVANNAGAVVFVAPFGTLFLKNGISLNSAVAARIILDNNATVTYEAGLLDIAIVSSPNYRWLLNSWKEI